MAPNKRTNYVAVIHEIINVLKVVLHNFYISD